MRSASTIVNASLNARQLVGVIFVELDFDSGTVYLTNSGRDETWNGHTWKGLGALGQIEEISEGTDLQARGLRLSLSGVPTAMISVALQEAYQGRDCSVWFGVLDDDHVVQADPMMVFKGRMDTMPIQTGQTATITLTVESRLADWDRPRIRRYNDADHQSRHPGDLFFNHVEEFIDKELKWGRA